MSDDFEEILKRWLRDRAGNDRSAMQALAGNVAALPPRGPRRGSSWLRPAAVIVVLVAVLALGYSRQPGGGGEATATPAEATEGSTLPGGPEPYADDPRLATCFGTPADMEFVFEMTHARDYQRYLPQMDLSPELDLDDAALAVIYRDGWAGVSSGGAPGGEPATPMPGHRFVCVLVKGGDPNLYADVDISGLTIAVTPTEANSASPSPGPTEPPPTGTTPEPAPAWVSDLASQLECDGPVANIGGEYPDNFGRPDPTANDTPQGALAAFLGPTNPFASLPRAGFVELHAEPHWASFGHLVSGRSKAIILLSDGSDVGPGWSVVGLRACDASEFDPGVPLTYPVTIWKDLSGHPISTETIRSAPGPEHCGWESTVWLQVDEELFFRDPAGVMGFMTTTTFDPDAHLPASAVDSGFRSGVVALWLDPGGDAYLVSSDGVERWPRSRRSDLTCS